MQIPHWAADRVSELRAKQPVCPKKAVRRRFTLHLCRGGFGQPHGLPMRALDSPPSTGCAGSGLPHRALETPKQLPMSWVGGRQGNGTGQ